MEIYLARDNVQAGPYSKNELQTMLQSGEVVASDLLWHDAMDNWATVGEMADHLFGAGFMATRGGKAATMPVDLHKNNSIPKEAKANNAKDPQQTASILSRIAALAINVFLYTVVMFPFIRAVLGSELVKKEPADFATTMALGEKLAQAIPHGVANLAVGLLLALVLVQCLLIAKRGQSIGKLVVGIRVVDKDSKKVPSVMQSVGLRGVLLFVVYFVISSFSSVLPFAIAANYVVAFLSKDGRGLHDRLAGTMVLKAHKDQVPVLENASR